MKREFLKELGISGDTLDKIMAEHGKDIEKYKSGAAALAQRDAELDGLKNQLAAANKQIEDFKGLDIDGIRQAADDWKTKYEQAEQDNAARLEQLRFDHALEGALLEAGARNTKAVKALLELEGLRLEEDGIAGLSGQLEKVKADNEYLFQAQNQTPPPRVVGATSGLQTQYTSGVEAAFYSFNPGLKG